jgi:hypothetical protein
MLAISGKLLPDAGGPPRWPEVPEHLLKGQPGIVESMLGKDEGRRQGWYTDPIEKTDVRSVYLIRKRALPVPFLQAFDLPDANVPCTKRTTTTVAPQALVLLNNPFSVRMSQEFASRIAREAGKDDQRAVELAYRLAIGRIPTPAEAKVCMDLLQRHRAMHNQRPDPALAALIDLCRVVFNLNEFAYID